MVAMEIWGKQRLQLKNSEVIFMFFVGIYTPITYYYQICGFVFVIWMICSHIYRYLVLIASTVANVS